MFCELFESMCRLHLKTLFFCRSNTVTMRVVFKSKHRYLYVIFLNLINLLFVTFEDLK